MSAAGGPNDRGMKKWQGLFLNEHTHLLKNYWHDYGKLPEPAHDEWTLNEYAEQINKAYNAQCAVKISFWNNGEEKTANGIVGDLNASTKTITIHTLGNNRIRIPFVHILSIDIDLEDL